MNTSIVISVLRGEIKLVKLIQLLTVTQNITYHGLLSNSHEPIEHVSEEIVQQSAVSILPVNPEVPMAATFLCVSPLHPVLPLRPLPTPLPPLSSPPFLPLLSSFQRRLFRWIRFRNKTGFIITEISHLKPVRSRSDALKKPPLQVVQYLQS